MSLETIKERVAAATPGPWRSRPPSEVPPKERARYGCVFFGTSLDEPYSTSPLEKPDATFIAHARTDIERLLAVAEAAALFQTAMDAAMEYGDSNDPTDRLWDTAASAGNGLRAALAALEAGE